MGPRLGSTAFGKCTNYKPYRLMTRIQLRRINGISSAVASKYSSNEPPNSFGWPVIFMRPMRFRFGTCDLTSSVAFVVGVESLANSLRRSSAFASNRAMRDVPKMYSRIFCNPQRKKFSRIQSLDNCPLVSFTHRNIEFLRFLFVRF